MRPVETGVAVESIERSHDITRLISESLERPLPFRTRIAMRIHYVICVWCERYRNQLGFLRESLRSLPDRGSPELRGRLSPEARTRLKIAVKPKD